MVRVEDRHKWETIEKQSKEHPCRKEIYKKCRTPGCGKKEMVRVEDRHKWGTTEFAGKAELLYPAQTGAYSDAFPDGARVPYYVKCVNPGCTATKEIKVREGWPPPPPELTP